MPYEAARWRVGGALSETYGTSYYVYYYYHHYHHHHHHHNLALRVLSLSLQHGFEGSEGQSPGRAGCSTSRAGEPVGILKVVIVEVAIAELGKKQKPLRSVNKTSQSKRLAYHHPGYDHPYVVLRAIALELHAIEQPPLARAEYVCVCM